MAQKVRLGYSNLRRSISSLGVLAGTMIIRSREQSQRTHEAMVARGYSGSMPFGPMPGMKSADWWIMGLAPLMIISAYIVLEWGVL